MLLDSLQLDALLSLSLTHSAVERAALRLDYALDGSLFASQTKLVGAVIYQMLVLITTLSIDRVSVSPIAQCRSLLFNRLI